VPGPLTATQLRADVYNVLDEVLRTGGPREVSRRGQIVLLVPADGRRRFRLADLPRREGLACTFDQLVDTGWDYVPDDDPA